jgi:hypothetical protein
MPKTLNDSEVRQIISILGVKTPEYNEFYLTNKEIETLYKLSLEQKNNNYKIAIRTSNSSGIGTNVKVVIDKKETDITDYDAW